MIDTLRWCENCREYVRHIIHETYWGFVAECTACAEEQRNEYIPRQPKYTVRDKTPAQPQPGGGDE